MRRVGLVTLLGTLLLVGCQARRHDEEGRTMPLSVGDELRFDGQTGTVVALASTTDADGRGWVTYEGQMFQFRALKGEDGAGQYPLVVAADPVFRVGLLLRQKRAGDNPEAESVPMFALVLDDGPAPWGWGRRVQGKSSWNTAGEYAETDAVVFRMGWMPGPVYIRKAGIPVQPTDKDSGYASLRFTWSTSDGTHVSPWNPDFPSEAFDKWGFYKGRFRTDANGRLWDYSDGTEQPIIIPRGFGALGYRAADAWAGARVSERMLTKLEVWYLQESAEVYEGASITLNVAGGSVLVVGPSGAHCTLIYEDGPYIAGGTLAGTPGTVTVSGLAPGRYTVALHHPTDATKGLRRQDVTVPGAGESTAVTFSTTWAATANGTTYCGYVYAYGSTGAAGVTVWGIRLVNGPPLLWSREAVAVTDGDGWFEFDTNVLGWVPHDLVIDCEHGAWWYDGSGAYWLDPSLGGRFSGVPALDGKIVPPVPGLSPTLSPWGKAGPHKNLPTGVRFAYAESSHDGSKTYFRPTEHGGVTTDPLPAWRVPNWTFPDPPGEPAFTDDRIEYTLYASDGTALGYAEALSSGLNEPWYFSTSQTENNASHVGQAPAGQCGGKIAANVVEHAPAERVTTDNLPEAARMGLETGKFTQPLEVRLHSPTAGEDGSYVRPTTFGGFECPFCGGPAHMGPDTAEGLERGFCVPCYIIGGTYVDCRTYSLSQTLAAVKDWSTRVVKDTTGGGHADRLVSGWPRPCEYYETDAYLQTYVDGLQRWVSRHVCLGWWLGDSFVDAESIPVAEARVGDTIGPVQLKLLLNAQYVGTGKTVQVTAIRADNGVAEVLGATVPPGSPAGTIIPLRPCPHHEYPSGSWFTDVTNVAAQGDGDLRAKVVNDGPSWRSSAGCIVTSSAYSPWACDALLGQYEPECRVDYLGNVHCVYNREGMLVHKTWAPGRTAWSEADVLTDKAGWTHPCEHHAFEIVEGILVVTCESDGKRIWFKSETGGETWTLVEGAVAATDLKHVQTAVDYMSRVWTVGVDGNSLLTSEASPNFGKAAYFRARVDESPVDAEQPAFCTVGGIMVVVVSQGGQPRIRVSKMGGSSWE